MKQVTRGVAAGAVAVALGGCNASPTVRYDLVTSAADRKSDEFDAYYLQGTKLRIAVVSSDAQSPAGAKGAAAKTPPFNVANYQVSSLPIEVEGFKLGLAHADPIGISTTVNLTKIANTDLVSQAGVQVTDNRVAYINEAAGIIKTIIGFVPFAAVTSIPTSSLPLDIDLTAELAKPNIDGPKTTTLSPTNGIQIIVDAIPPDAVPFSTLQFPIKTGDFIYSACRTATITARLSDGPSTGTLTATVKIADPNFVQRVAFPVKGNVSTHSQCGVSVVTDASPGTSNGLDIVNALATQGKAIKDAIDAAKKPSK